MRKTIAPFLIHTAAAAHRRLWWTRAVTLGVRAVVLDEAERVFLVRHSYRPGWYLPGGGVDRGETAEAGVVRELREEGGLRCLERPTLHGLFRNPRSGRDHVACYVVRAFEPIVGSRPDWEIAEAGFFPVAALPDGTTEATQERIDEVLLGRAPASDW